MLKVILFDLDGTLLPLDVDTFLQDYIKALAAKVASITEPKAFINQLLYATAKVIEDKDPEATNQEVFWKHFVIEDFGPREELVALLDEFYSKDFPLLGANIETDGRAAEVIKELKERGFRIALATNAVFPRIAVIERMRWASLDPQDFELITTFENMHFCKPHIEYYQEVLEYLGERPESCIMVGNDVEEDMIAGRLGMKTFLLENYVIDRGSRTPYDYRGDLDLLRSVIGL